MKIYSPQFPLAPALPSWASSTLQSPELESRLVRHRILTPNVLKLIQDSTASQHSSASEVLTSLQSLGIVVPSTAEPKPLERARFPRWHFGKQIYDTMATIRGEDHNTIQTSLQSTLAQLPDAIQFKDSCGKKLISMSMLSVNLIGVVTILSDLWENDLESLIDPTHTDIAQIFLSFGAQLLANKPIDEVPDFNLVPGFTHESSQSWAILGMGAELMADFYILTGKSNSRNVQDLLDLSQRLYTWADTTVVGENIRDARQKSANKLCRIRERMRSALLSMVSRADEKSRLLQ